jgi:hypothetical protein
VNLGKPRLDAALLIGADDRAVPGRGSGGGRRAGCGGARCCCRSSSVAAAAVHACPGGSRGCPQCRGVRAPAVRQAASGVRASGQPLPAGCVDLACVTSTDEQAQRGRRCHGAGTAAVGPPPSCRSRPPSRTPRPVSRELQNRTRRTPWMSAAASGTAVGVRTVDVRRGHFCSLRVSAATGSGRRWPTSAGGVQPPPPSLPDLLTEPLAELLAHVGHGRPLQRQRLLGG